MIRLRLLLALFLPVVLAPAQGQDLVPFVIPGAPAAASPLTCSARPIETTSPRVTVSDGHFVREGQRFRLWGTNTSHSGSLPLPADAKGIAARMAGVGVNCVRFHHLDTSTFPDGIWSADGNTLDPQALHRLDTFIAELAAHGIYVDLNLHVGRVHSSRLGLPQPNTRWDKLVDLFTPELVQAQKDYAAQLLNHVNPIRNVRYADDPAIALVEISNEDSFFMPGGEEKLRTLPPFYADILQARYNEWLTARYGDDLALAAAWNPGGATEPGPNLIRNNTFETTTANGLPQHWGIEIHGTAAASGGTYFRAPYPCGRLQVVRPGTAAWELQVKQPGLTVEAQKTYRVTFIGASDTTKTIHVEVAMNHGSFSSLGLSQDVTLGPEWTTHTLSFNAVTTDTNAKLSFWCGGTTPTVYLTHVDMREPGDPPFLPGESLTSGTVRLYPPTESAPRTADRYRFLTETEKGFYDDMRQYIRTTLGSGVLVGGTVGYPILGLLAQRDMDYIDVHPYWQHPVFPTEEFDEEQWTIEQLSMTGNPENASVFGAACTRLAGKPFLVSEYNHSAPNDFQAECVPMIASFAAAQDWDGVLLYDYGNDYATSSPTTFRSQFKIASNPSKWGFMRAGSAIFRDGAIEPLPRATTVQLAPTPDSMQELVALQGQYGLNIGQAVRAKLNASWPALLSQIISVSFESSGTIVAEDSGTTTSWEAAAGRGVYSVKGIGAQVFTGDSSDLETSTAGMLAVSNVPFTSLAVCTLDGLPLSASLKLLVTASGGRCENTNMSFDDDRRTVHSNWGDPPTRIQPVTGSLVLPSGGDWTAQVLAPDGGPSAAAVVTTGSEQRLQLAAEAGTLWYLLDRSVSPPDVTPPSVSVGPPSVSTVSSGPVSYVVTYSEPCTISLTAADVQLLVTGNNVAAEISVTGSGPVQRTVTLSNITGDGTVGFRIGAGTAVDAAGNVALGSENSPVVVVRNDFFAPSFGGIVASPSLARMGTEVQIEFTASEALSGNPTVLVGGHPAAFVSRSGNDYVYALNWNWAMNGAVVIDVSGTDLANNSGASQSAEALVIDTTAPSAVRLEPLGSCPTDAPEKDYWALFDEPVAGVDDQDFQVRGGGAAGAVALVNGSGTSYTITVRQVSGAGPLALDIVDVTGITDLAGNPLAQQVTGTACDVDQTTPVLQIVAPTDGAWSNRIPVPLLWTASEDLETSFGLVEWTSFQGDETSAVVELGDEWISEGSGLLTAYGIDFVGRIAEAVAEFGIDITSPTLVLDSYPAWTNATQLSLGGQTADSGSGVARVGWTLNGVGQADAAVNPSGQVLLQSAFLPEGPHAVTAASVDLAGNASTTSTLAFTVDRTPPTLSLSPPSVTLTRSGPVSYTVTYTGATAISLNASAILLHKTGTANGVVSVTGSGVSSRTVTITSITGDGTLSISVAGGTATDAAGNAAGPSAVSGGVTVDNTRPSLVFTPSGGGPTRASSFPLTVTFSEPVTGLAGDDVTLTNATVSNYAAQPGGRVYSCTLTPIQDGVVSLSLRANAAFDAAGNGSLQGSASVISDRTPPSVTLSGPSVSATSRGPASYTVTYGGASSISLTAAKVTLLRSGTATGTVAVSGTGTSTRTVTIGSITGDGTLAISLAAGTAVDAAGNTAPSAGPSAAVTVDSTLP